MIQVNITQAKSEMERLIEAVEGGERVVITRWKQPAVEMMPVNKSISLSPVPKPIST
jgi:antitoxin (DNA-binding transcriptional repressor) of toxin-antitoxin stability system